MTEAEQKAREIVKRHEDAIFTNVYTNGTGVDETSAAIACALLEVDAIIKALEEYDTRTEQYIREEIAALNYSSAELQNMDGDFRWWNQVKEALKQL